MKAVAVGRGEYLGGAVDEADVWSARDLAYSNDDCELVTVDLKTGIAYRHAWGRDLELDELSPWRRS